MADIPGLIEGASEGAGLGHEFLRHIERTKVLLHVVDAASVEGRDPIEDVHAIMDELSAYNPELLKLPQVSQPISLMQFMMRGRIRSQT